MTRLRCCRFAFWATAKLLWLCLALSGFAFGQILNEDNEIQVHDLPSLVAHAPLLRRLSNFARHRIPRSRHLLREGFRTGRHCGGRRSPFFEGRRPQARWQAFAR